MTALRHRAHAFSRLIGMVLAPVVVLTIPPSPTVADTSPSAVHLRYEARWGGLHAADFALSVTDLGESYQADFRLEGRGIIGWFLRLRVHSESEGVFASPVAPSRYRVDYTNRFRERSVTVHFDPSGGEAVPMIRTKGVSGDKDRETADKVPRTDRFDVIDPVAALVQALRNVRTYAAGGDDRFVLKVYDGRRRFDLEGEVTGPMKRSIRHQTHDVYRLRLEPRPVSGFKDRHRETWNDTAFDIFVSADDRHVMLQVMPVGVGPVMNLVGECDRPCPLGDD